MLRSIAQRQRRESSFVDPGPMLADLWRRFHELTSARLGPLAGLLIVLLIVLWAIGEHAQRRAILQEVETQRYIEQFTEGPVAAAQERLNRHASGPSRALRTAPAGTPNDEMVRNLGLAEDVDTVLRFYRRLALCIRMASCDRAAAATWFGNLPWRFRDRHQPYLEGAYPDEDLDALFLTVSPRPGMEPNARAGLD